MIRNAIGQFAAVHTTYNVADLLIEVVRENAKGNDVPFLDSRGRVAIVGKLHSVHVVDATTIKVRVWNGRIVHDIRWKICGMATGVVGMLSSTYYPESVRFRNGWSLDGRIERLTYVVAPGF